MKVVIAMDSFKGAATSKEVGEACKKGIHRVDSSIEVVVKCLADGGEGTMDALITYVSGEKKEVSVCDPLFKKITSSYGLVLTKKLAIIEMASCSGLPLLKEEERNPMYTTTYGVGEVIKDAIEQGVRHFIVGIGGSATSEAGIGMLSALGYRFLDVNNQEIMPIAEQLINIVSIDDSNVDGRLKECTFEIACDVTNPLYGRQGAAYIYGKQKGATVTEIKYIDQGLQHFAQVVEKKYQTNYVTIEGTGAAGGLGFAFLSFLNAELKSGIDIVLETIELEKEIKDATIVITGEGKFDSQSLHGKAPLGVSRLAKKYNKKVIVLAGSIEEDMNMSKAYKEGVTASFCIHPTILPLDEAMKKEVTLKNMERTIEQIFRLL